MLLLLFFLILRKITTMKTFSYAMIVPALALGLALPSSALTREELLAQIAQLQAQLAQLQGTQTTGTITSTYVHSLTLKTGSRGQQVRTLQMCMNALGYSTGVADGIYGKNTAKGIKAFQASKGLVADGIIGPKTGPVFQAACAVLNPNGNTNTDTETNQNNTQTNNQEASIKSTQLQREDDARNNQNNQKVASFTIELDKKSGDMNLQRADIIMEVTDYAGSESDLWDMLDTITLTRDGKKLTSASADSKSAWSRIGSTNQYKIRLDSFTSTIKENTEGEFMISVDTQKMKDSDLDITIDLGLELRYRDGAGITGILDNGDFGTTSFDITNNEQGDVSLSLAQNSQSLVISGDEVNKKLGQSLIVFDIEALYNNVSIDEIEAEFTVTGVKTDARDLVKKAYLYKGSKLIDSGTIAANGKITFDLDEFEIDEDDSETFTIKADLDNVDGVDVTDGATITVMINKVTGEDVNSEDINMTDVLTGKTHTYSASAPMMELTETNFVVTTVNDAADYATAEFTFQVTAGTKKDVYLSSNLSDWGITVTGGTAGSFIITADDSDIETGSGFKIQKGQTETFTISQIVIGTNSYAKVTIDSVKWDIDNATTSFDKTLTNGFANFKTASKYITS